MRISSKTVNKIVRVVSDHEVHPDYRRHPWAFPIWVADWPYFADDDEYIHAGDYAFIPEGTMGLVVAHAQPFPNVTMNYAKVLFPQTKSSDDLWSTSEINPAGCYWISGEFIEEVPEEEF